MKHSRAVYVLAGVLLTLGIVGAALHFGRKAAWKPAPNSRDLQKQRPSQTQPNTAPAGVPQDPAALPADFLGSLRPGGHDESAGRERTYIVSYQVAFLRKSPSEKLPEETKTYQELLNEDVTTMAPHLYYGESLQGNYDPAQPDSIAVRARIDGKEASGYVDAHKLWLEPPLDPVETDRYLCTKNILAVHVVPDPSSPPSLSLLQGEVVEAVGQFSFQGQQWIKARFNPSGRPRFGFILASDMKTIAFSSVNQSVVTFEEVPQQIRGAKWKLSDADRARLSKDGFYIEEVPPLDHLDVDDMADSYLGYQGLNGRQYFITSDLFLHSFHLIFDRMLQDTEEKKIFPTVRKMSSHLANAAENELHAVPASVPELRDALQQDLFYFSVAAKLFNPKFTVAAAVRSQTGDYVSKIEEAAEGDLPSAQNFVGFEKEDFTQYKVRGHYLRNETLQRYFRGMMWFGRHEFLLSKQTDTLAALLVPGLVDKAQERHAFERLDAQITYLVGRQDKYTLAGYRSVNQKVFGTEAPDLHSLAGNLDTKVTLFQQAVPDTLPGPQIVSAQSGTGLTQEQRLVLSRGFKFLGQRYTLDAFIMNQLTSPSVGTDANPRNLPSALDVMMLLGSKASTDLQQGEQEKNHWLNYESQIGLLRGSVARQLAQRSTFYEDWLRDLRALFLPTQSQQLFALGAPWQYKNLNAGAASWTELKHDTILYAEQSAAEMGEGDEFEIPGFDSPEPRGYVEPNPAFFRELEAFIDRMIARLKGSDFITEEYLDKFTLFRDLAHKAGVIAQKEVGGEPITRDDYRWIENLRSSFDSSLLLSRDATSITDPSSLQMALIADVANDALGGRVLEVGVGTPERITVIVKDAWGGTRLTVGYVYSWYEFPSKKRWSDSEWKKMIYSSDPKEREQEGIEVPGWYSKFLKIANGAS
jgi:hypothetical protein